MLLAKKKYRTVLALRKTYTPEISEFRRSGALNLSNVQPMKKTGFKPGFEIKIWAWV